MDSIWNNIFKHRNKEIDEIDKVLLNIPIFKDLKQRELKEIKRILHKREYRMKEEIFHEGDVGLGMYIILKGIIEIVCENGRLKLAELNKGDFFGELALLDDSPRSATAITKTPSTLLCFFKPELLDIIKRNPKLGGKILFRLAWTLGERLKKTNDQIRKMCIENVSTK